jgi:hypothetical protein
LSNEKWLRQDNSSLILKVEFLNLDKLSNNKEGYSEEETKIYNKLEHSEEVVCLGLLLSNNQEVCLEVNQLLLLKLLEAVGYLDSKTNLNLDHLVFLDKVNKII